MLDGDAWQAAYVIGLAFAHETCIHIDAAHPFRTECACAQSKCHAGIDAARNEEEDIAIPHRVANLLFEHWRAMGRVPILHTATYPVYEVREVLPDRKSTRLN